MVYLDYSATTPVLPEILDSYNKVTKDYFGNPNSLHSLGTKSKELLNEALKQICDIFKINNKELIITSGATESNNMALIGTALSCGKKGSRIIVSKLEHESIYGICKYLEKNDFIIDYVNNDSDGVIDFEDLKKLITKDTILVSICAVNSELGIRQPLKTIKQIINKENPNIIFHSDMTQAIGKVPVILNDVDLASFSAHKIYGFKGVGVLYKKNSVNIKPIMYGSSDDLRPGTPPLPLIVTLSKALRIATSDLSKKEAKIAKLNEKISLSLKKYPKILINKTKYSIPHILNISLMDIKPETVIHALEKHQIYVSSNTACSSGKISAAVLNIYKDKTRALTTLRISLSHLTSNEEISVFLNAFDGIYDKLNKLN
ncbi:MAG: cysteine desulfurase family protein [Bacilli bacterium]|nr:cysteine desulfurase family protein [Bacilli bacterium]